MTPKKDLELYLHIPFCRQKCRYCDFLSAPLAADSSTADGYVPEAYVDALLSQIVQESQFYQERRVTTIFWGGGTPSLLRVMDMERLMDAIRAHFCVADDAEITLESNPGTLDFEKLAGYRRAGINRLSMGLQSACDKELAMLGRIHNFDTFVQNYKQARRAGFENINVDLMSALPGQTVESWEQTLMKAAELAPEHLSAYSLIIEEGTPFWSWYGEDANQTLRPKEMLPLPSEEDERRMYARTREILERELRRRGMTTDDFSQITELGNIGAIQAMLRANLGISFFYQATLTDRETQLAPIELKDFSLEHEVMFIFRKNSSFREDYEEIYAFLTNRENSQN